MVPDLTLELMVWQVTVSRQTGHNTVASSSNFGQQRAHSTWKHARMDDALTEDEKHTGSAQLAQSDCMQGLSMSASVRQQYARSPTSSSDN
jgi:hypothetical protein